MRRRANGFMGCPGICYTEFGVFPQPYCLSFGCKLAGVRDYFYSRGVPGGFTMAFPIKTRIRAVHLRWELGSATKAHRAHVLELGRREAPPARTITRWAEGFEARGSVQPSAHTRRPHRLTPAVLRRLRVATRRSSRLSLRRLSARTGVTLITVHRAIRHLLGLFPYKLQPVQRLHRGDKAKRLQCCRWLLSKWKLPSFRKGPFHD